MSGGQPDLGQELTPTVGAIPERHWPFALLVAVGVSDERGVPATHVEELACEASRTVWLPKRSSQTAYLLNGSGTCRYRPQILMKTGEMRSKDF